MAFHYCTLENGTKILEDGSVVDRGCVETTNLIALWLSSGNPLVYGWCDVLVSLLISVLRLITHWHRHVLDILKLLVPPLTMSRFVEKLVSENCALTGVECLSIYER